MISVGKTVFRCRQAKLTVEAARQVAIMEVSNLAIEKYGLSSLPKVVLEQLEVSLESAYFCGDWPKQGLPESRKHKRAAIAPPFVKLRKENLHAGD